MELVKTFNEVGEGCPRYYGPEGDGSHRREELRVERGGGRSLRVPGTAVQCGDG